MIRTKPYEINDESESIEEEFSEEYYHDDDETTIDSITTTEESFTTDWNIVDIFTASTTIKTSTSTPNPHNPKNPSIRSWSNTTVIKCEQFCNPFFLGHLIFCLFTDNEIEAKIDDHILAQQLQK